MSSTRLHTLAVVAAVAALAVAVPTVGGVLGSDERPDSSAVHTQTRPVTAYQDGYGVHLKARLWWPEAVTLTEPRAILAGRTEEGTLWPLDGDDHEGADLDRARLPAGTPVLLEGWIRPRCDSTERSGRPVLSVRKRGRGGSTLVEVHARDVSKIQDAVERWCASGPFLDETGSSLEPDGTAVASITVINPGTEPMTVEVPAYARGKVRWKAATLTVPAGGQRTLEIHGSGIECLPGKAPASWRGGRLRIDGKPFKLGSDDGWC